MTNSPLYVRVVAFVPAFVRAFPPSVQKVLKAVVKVAAPSTIAQETKPMSKAYSTPSWPASSWKNFLSMFIEKSPCFDSQHCQESESEPSPGLAPPAPRTGCPRKNVRPVPPAVPLKLRGIAAGEIGRHTTARRGRRF